MIIRIFRAFQGEGRGRGRKGGGGGGGGEGVEWATALSNRFQSLGTLIFVGGRNSSLVVFGLAVHSVAGSILLWGHFPVEGISPLELTWIQTPFPPKLFRMRV